MFNDMNNTYEKIKSWTKKHPAISACMFICGGYFFYKLIYSVMYPKQPRIKSNKPKGDMKITPEKKENPKSNEITPNENIIQTKVNSKPFNEIIPTQKLLLTPEPSTSTPSTPVEDEIIFKVKPVQALSNSNDINISLETFAGKYLFLIFYPQNLAKRSEIISLNKATPKFESLNVSLVGCSNDNKFSHVNLNRSLGKEGINFPLIGDDKNKMSSLFNIGLDNAGKNKPTTLIFSPTGELLKRIDTIDTNTLLAEAEKLTPSIG